MTDDTKKSLTQHWREKEEYNGKVIVQRMPPKDANGRPDWDHEDYDDTPIIVADSWEEAFDEAEKQGYNTVSHNDGSVEQNVVINVFMGAGPKNDGSSYDGPIIQ